MWACMIPAMPNAKHSIRVGSECFTEWRMEDLRCWWWDEKGSAGGFALRARCALLLEPTSKTAPLCNTAPVCASVVFRSYDKKTIKPGLVLSFSAPLNAHTDISLTFIICSSGPVWLLSSSNFSLILLTFAFASVHALRSFEPLHSQ